jgi:hypothetical protein
VLNEAPGPRNIHEWRLSGFINDAVIAMITQRDYSGGIRLALDVGLPPGKSPQYATDEGWVSTEPVRTWW